MRSAALFGVDAVPVEVEVDVSPGLPAFTVVGLPDQSVSEARERVRAAVRNAGLPFPAARITVNLAPADLRKEGPLYDLPIALGCWRRRRWCRSRRWRGRWWRVSWRWTGRCGRWRAR